jgi:hypothetical protein
MDVVLEVPAETEQGERVVSLDTAAFTLIGALNARAVASGSCPVCHGEASAGTISHRPRCPVTGLGRAMRADRRISLSPTALREHWSHLDDTSTSMAGATDEDLLKIADAVLDDDYIWNVFDEALANARDRLGIEQSSLGIRVGRGDLAAIDKAIRNLGYSRSGFMTYKVGHDGGIKGIVVQSGRRSALVTSGDDWGTGFVVGDVDSPATSSDIPDERDVPDTGNTLDDLARSLAKHVGSPPEKRQDAAETVPATIPDQSFQAVLESEGTWSWTAIAAEIGKPAAEDLFKRSGGSLGTAIAMHQEVAQAEQS